MFLPAAPRLGLLEIAGLAWFALLDSSPLRFAEGLEFTDGLVFTGLEETPETPFALGFKTVLGAPETYEGLLETGLF
jgi:hypothetical protein